MAVWVKHGTAPAFLVALVENKLDLKSLSERLELNVKSLKAGDFALDADASGMSRHVDEIKAFAGMADGGDGSKSCPFVIEGEAIVPSRVVTGGSASDVYERDITFEVRDAVATPARPVPAVEELHAFLSQVPEQRFPVPPTRFLRLPDQNRDKIFRPAKPEENCLGIVRIVDNIIDPPSAGGSKDNFHHFWDSLISDALAFFYVGDTWIKVRNKAGEGSSGILRPDFIARFARLYALLRGEEKGPDSKGDPAMEIMDKMEWTYGTSIPYLLGYFAREYLVTFCSLRWVNGLKYRDDILTFNLTQATDRVGCFIACLNCARLLMTLKDLCISTNAEPDFTEFERVNGKLVRIHQRKVVKEYSRLEQYELVRNLYSMLVFLGAEVMLHFNDKHKTIVFERAYCHKPRSLDELGKCITSICEMLVLLHGACLMHRDIRWENVACSEAGHWILLDFDEACRSPSAVKHMLKPQSHAPEMTTGEHDTSVDMWGVGYLLKTANVGLSERLQQLKLRCLNQNPTLRPSASAALTYLYHGHWDN